MRKFFNDLLPTMVVLAILPLFMSDAVNAEAVSFAPAGPAATPGAAIPKAIPAKLSLPSKATGRVPVVVIAHAGSGLTAEGPEPGYVATLNAAGIGTLTIDMWTPRGVPSGPAAFGGNGSDDRGRAPCAIPSRTRSAPSNTWPAIPPSIHNASGSWVFPGGRC